MGGVPLFKRLVFVGKKAPGLGVQLRTTRVKASRKPTNNASQEVEVDSPTERE